MNYKSTTIKSKWTKTKWLLKNADVRAYVPKTLRFNRRNLSMILSQYPTVYFKPTTGSGGFNIIRIKKQGNGYQIQHNSEKNHCSTLEALYGKLKKHARKRSYLLQKGIHLATVNGNSFDIRVMVQKTNNGIWKSSALFTKIGKRGKVTTNYHQGGQIGYFKNTLSQAGFSYARVKRKEAELKRLGRSVGRIFDRHGSRFRELGLDVALDKTGNAWILEVNTRPQFYPLKHLKDKSMYRRITSYAKQYGRKK